MTRNVYPVDTLKEVRDLLKAIADRCGEGEYTAEEVRSYLMSAVVRLSNAIPQILVVFERASEVDYAKSREHDARRCVDAIVDILDDCGFY